MTRLQFDVVDILNTAIGFGGIENHGVLPNEILRKMASEYERLYTFEDTAREFYAQAKEGAIDMNLEREIKAQLGLHGQETFLLDYFGALQTLCLEYFGGGPTPNVETEKKIITLLGIEPQGEIEKK